MRLPRPTRSPRLPAFLLAAFLPAALLAAETIPAAQARHHVGEETTVCGEVASTRYAASSRGQPTFLNLEEPYPDQVFTVVIWIEDRGKFEAAPEVRFRDEPICVSGTITSYRGVPQIVVDEPRQIEVQDAEDTTPERTAKAPPPPSPPPRNCRPRSECCRICSKGKACGNSCISRSYRCHKGRGCACDSSEVCR